MNLDDPENHSDYAGMRVRLSAVATGKKVERDGGKGLTDEQNARVREAIEKRLLPMFGHSQSKLAPHLGITQPALSGFLGGRQGTSFPAALRAAQLLGEDPLEFLGVTPVADPDHFPARARARLACRLLGKEEQDIEAGLLGESKSDEMRTAAQWAQRVDLAEAHRKSGLERPNPLNPPGPRHPHPPRSRGKRQ